MYQSTIEDVLAHARDGLFVIDQERRCRAFSPACERITGFPADELLGQKCDCKSTGECGDAQVRSVYEALCPGLEVFRGSVSTCRQRLRFRRRDGRLVWIENRYSPLHDGQGHVACVLGVMHDITGARDIEKPLRNGDQNGGIVVSQLEPLLPEPAVAHLSRNGNGNGAELVEEGDGPLDRILAAVERREILSALRTADGQRTQAARALGISRSRLYRRMEALQIDPREDV